MDANDRKAASFGHMSLSRECRFVAGHCLTAIGSFDCHVTAVANPQQPLAVAGTGVLTLAEQTLVTIFGTGDGAWHAPRVESRAGAT